MAKKRITDLAYFGGMKLFENPLHVGAPNLPDRQRLMQQIDSLLTSRRLTNRGPMVRELEQRIAEFTGVKHCIAMCNGTIALEIAIRALGMQGEVIIPSMTFIATAHALQWQEITPVFADIHPQSATLDARKIERLITPRTTGIIGVHLWGRSSDTHGLQAIADKHGLKLLFDAAHAFGVSHEGKMIGGFGDAEVLSFHATKFFNTFEGGAVLTNNDELAEKIRLMQNFGFSGRDNVIYIGTNGKMSEISAAMGLASLESLPRFVEHNRNNYHTYLDRLQNIQGIDVFEYNEKEKNNYQYIVLKIDESKTVLNRDELADLLSAERILARRYFYPGCHRMEPYRSYFPNAGLLLPETERLLDCVLTLPTGTSVSKAEITTICELLHFIVSNGREIKQKIRAWDYPENFTAVTSGGMLSKGEH